MCNCRKNKGLKSGGTRPIISPGRAARDSVRATRTNAEQRTLNAQSTEAPKTPGMSKDRRAVEKRRRDIIRKSFGK
jgi:hypothetical protein